MTDDEWAFRGGVVAGFVGILEMLIAELDRGRVLDKTKFAELLRHRINAARSAARAHLPQQRYDLLIEEALADFLSDTRKPRWVPTVVPGTKDDG